MASYSFDPQSTQLDNDETPDLQAEVGDRTMADSILDTSGDVDGNDVTDISEPAGQAIDLQPSSPVQPIFGTEKSDSIFGTPQNDLVFGREGNDIFTDSEGDDRFFGDVGNDVLLDNAGNDTIIGGAGNDFVGIIIDGGGDELIDLGVGNDVAFGGAGADTFVLNRDAGVTAINDFTSEDRFALSKDLNRDDLSFAQLDNEGLGLFNGSTLINDAHTGKLLAFVSAAPVETVSNAEFVDAAEIVPTDNSLPEGEGSLEPIQVELFEAQSGDIFGTSDDDTLVGDDGANLILAGSKDDLINAGAGDDSVFGENNLDVLNGEAGNDLLNGGANEDILNGGEGNDTLLGEAADTFNILNGDEGDDFLVGGADGDTISGGQGDDSLFGGAGNDGLFGDEGHDTFVLASGEEADIIFDFEPEQDAIAFVGGLDYNSVQLEYNAHGNYTNVSEETGELIATLIGVEADRLTESDFTTI